MWLVAHRRCLTADNLARRGWPHNDRCALCMSTEEDCTHLFVHCCYTQQVWHRFRAWTKADFPIPDDNLSSTEDWRLTARKRAPKHSRRDFDTISILVHLLFWKERNARIFRQQFSSADRVLELIIDEIRTWRGSVNSPCLPAVCLRACVTFCFLLA
jgi:hypothetical protein